MLRLALLLTLAVAAPPARAAESVRTWFAETATPAAEVLGALSDRMPPEVSVVQAEDTGLVAYTGDRVPVALSRFLVTAFPDLDPQVVAPGRTVSLSLHVSAPYDATEMSLVLLGRFPDDPDRAAALPEDARILLDGRGAADCTGQVVTHHPAPPDAALALYRSHFTDAGFVFDDAPGETSFFVGYRGDCGLGLYLQPDDRSTLIVITYLED